VNWGSSRGDRLGFNNRVMQPAAARRVLVPTTVKHMSQTVRFQETLRRLVIFDTRVAEAGFGPGLCQTPALDAKCVFLNLDEAGTVRHGL
jgi:hypothetical protein